MEGEFEVRQGKQRVGKVQVIPQGLYVRIICRCHIQGDQVRRLYAQTEDGRESLGVLVPEADGFFLDRRIPAKRLGENVSFLISAGGGKLEGIFVPISPQEPFAYIDRLKDAFLETRQGSIGIRIGKHPEAL